MLIMEYMAIQYNRNLESFDTANNQREYLVKRTEIMKLVWIGCMRLRSALTEGGVVVVHKHAG